MSITSTDWAVVTGASSGFGALFARRLAERGHPLVLTGRDAARLDVAREEVKRHTPGAVVETVVADLATENGLEVLLTQLKNKDVDVLVNNAGFGTYGRFAEVPAWRESTLIAVDVTAVVRLAHALLPAMRARGRGRILNVASTIAFQPAPYQAVYGGAKAFVLSFSQALAEETRGSGITVTALCPGPTRTGFTDALKADVSETAIYRKLAEPGPVVDAGLRALDRGRPVVVPGLGNRAMTILGRIAPSGLLIRLTARMLSAPDKAGHTASR
ncbi:SDR family NAD(P)-dependent oxidoreductase [Streptomyces afghaniensis]|uniref:SDR family NAD(P)-dependent oxidoreductase n=1 Tax=Streptomyces afghaniensis TaxID=66865 RepID=UPI0037BA29BA